MEKEGLLEPQTQKLIKTYTTVYRIVFQYSFFVIPIIVWIIVAFLLQSKEPISTKTINATFKQNTYTVSNGMYTPSRVSDQVGPILDWIGDIKILWWDLQATGSVLIWRNNIVSLQDIVLPDQQYIIDFDYSGSVSSFENEYNVNDLIWVLNNWILSVPPRSATDTNSSSVINDTFFRESRWSNQETNMEQILNVLMERKYFINLNMEDFNLEYNNKGWIIEKYDLACISQFKIYDGFCNKNIEYFIQSLPSIDLENKWDDIFTISKSLKKKDHIDGFCANMMYNVFKQPYPSSKLDILMNGICSDYNLRYSQIKDFLKVENQLIGIMSDEVINNNLTVNLFKLTSIRQKIIIQSKNKTFDANTITAYLQFFNTLVHQNNMKVPQFYIDAGYYFNNVYLKNILKQESAISTNSAVKNEVATILDRINGINRGNEAIWVVGLEKLVKNDTLTELTKTRSNMTIISLQNLQSAFINFLRVYPEFGIDKAETDTNTRVARALWTLSYKTDNETRQESIIATFDYVDNRFELSSIRLPNNEPLDRLLISFLSHNRYATFSDTIEFIKNNGDYIPTTITMCTILDGHKNIQLESCSPTQATIAINDTPITFSIENDIIKTVNTSNQQWSTYLQNQINRYNGIGIDSIISSLEKMQVSEIKEPDEQISSVETERIDILGKFKQHLWVEPSSLTKQDGKWIATFEIQGHSFGAVVDIGKNYRLAPLVIKVNGQVITASSFSLPLIPFMQTTIDQFARDPMGFIKNVDNAAYQKVQLAGQKTTN